MTKPDAYPIPNITYTLDSMGHSKMFTVLDMASGYHQIPVKSEDMEKTAFSCHQGHFQFMKMPFGLNNAPATYQRCIDIILMCLNRILFGVFGRYYLFFSYYEGTYKEIAKNF